MDPNPNHNIGENEGQWVGLSKALFFAGLGKALPAYIQLLLGLGLSPLKLRGLFAGLGLVRAWALKLPTPDVSLRTLGSNNIWGKINPHSMGEVCLSFKN